MKNKLLIFLFLNIVPLISSASYHLMKNYNRDNYDGGTQNWEIDQDNLGQLYFANNAGVLKFDSNKWSLFPVLNGTSVRVVKYDDESDRLYVGASNEFGYFKPRQNNGKLEYTSLINTLEDKKSDLSIIWNIEKIKGRIWFQGNFDLFCYDGNKTTRVDIGKKISTISYVRDNMYIALEEDGVLCYRKNKIESEPALDLLKGKKVCAIFPYQDDKILFVTDFYGIFIYDGEKLEPLVTDIDDFLKKNQVFCADIKSNKIAFGTVQKGAVVKDISNGWNQDNNRWINTHTGLINNTVLSIKFDKHGNLWFGLNNGIGYELSNSPITNLFITNVDYGAGYASLLNDKLLYLGTNQGLYTMAYPSKNEPSSEKLPTLLYGQVWSLEKIGHDIFCGSDKGLYIINGSRVEKIKGIPGTWHIHGLRGNSNVVIASTYQGFYVIRKISGKWTLDNKITGCDDFGGHFTMDKSGNIWISHWMKGVYRLTPNQDYTKFDKIKLFNASSGLPLDRGNNIFNMDDKIIFSSEGGFFINKDDDSVVPYKPLNNLFGAQYSPKLHFSPNKDIWAINGTYFGVATRDYYGNYSVDTIRYKPLLSNIILGFEDLNFLSERRLLLSSIDGFYDIDLSYIPETIWKNEVIISSVKTDMDSLIYSVGAKIDSKDKIEIPYDKNSLIFEYVMPEYRNEKIRYSHILEKYDSEWSQYSELTLKGYTKLKAGDYVFRVKAFNPIENRISETSFAFTILPPWYISKFAIFIYFILTLIITILGIKMLFRWKNATALKIKKEKELQMSELMRNAQETHLKKEQEITALKNKQLEYEMMAKSNELSGTTMNVIRKNELLADLTNQVDKIIGSIEDGNSSTATLKYLIKIRKQIKENIDHDNDWDKFANNFDIVYDNFIKRLKAQYPMLAHADLRLCAYLKMGLSSKEIAPLLNISIRSVETVRYRLRKKMGIDHTINLSDYLQSY